VNSTTPHDHPEHDVHSHGTALSLDKLTKIFGHGKRSRAALDELDLKINRGEWIGLLGPNGSGKSTFLNIISGQLAATSGRCEVLGKPVENLDRSSIGVAFQTTALDPRLTIRENLLDLARLQGMSHEDSVAGLTEALARTELTERADDRVATLSGGLARRADLARAMLHHPDLILLDEPTGGLDPIARQRCLDHLAEVHQTQNRTIIMSTHLVEEAARSERVIMLHEGRCVADGAPEALCREIGDWILRIYETDFEPPSDEGWTRQGNAWTCPVSGSDDPVVEDLLSQHIELSVLKPTLADVFVRKSGQSLGHPEAVRS